MVVHSSFNKDASTRMLRTDRLYDTITGPLTRKRSPSHTPHTARRSSDKAGPLTPRKNAFINNYGETRKSTAVTLKFSRRTLPLFLTSKKANLKPKFSSHFRYTIGGLSLPCKADAADRYGSFGSFVSPRNIYIYYIYIYGSQVHFLPLRRQIFSS